MREQLCACLVVNVFFGDFGSVYRFIGSSVQENSPLSYPHMKSPGEDTKTQTQLHATQTGEASFSWNRVVSWLVSFGFRVKKAGCSLWIRVM